MSKLKLVAAVAALSAAILAPGLAEARGHHRHYRSYANPLPYPISYVHNYGPGITPGTFAFYDGPSTNHCYQSAAAYVGQDPAGTPATEGRWRGLRGHLYLAAPDSSNCFSIS